MKDKPTGSVTFLFTDIEGSTRLAQEFPESLPSALEKHHAIMHKVIESNNGFVFEIVGDAFCCAFEKSEDAIRAAVDAQTNLANEKWDDVKIKIRIGIHSGNAEWNGKRYMGYITLARTARVMSSAYGEQIIISNDTYELYFPKQEFGKESDGSVISFRDLGERRLKDLKQPVRLFQILSEGLREDFPPLKTLDARPNNLPVQLTSFIGREAEMKTVKDLLKQTHILTLTGSGGAGKTRLALQVATDVIDDFANGVWFVELASLSEPAFLPQVIMKVFDIKEEPKRSLEDTLCDYLRDKEILIILDNCEHLVEGCAKLTEKLLSNSPKLKIIATSREGLRCGGEQTHRVLSLEVPDPKDEDTPEKLSQYESVRLFIERALAVDSTFRVNNNNAPALAEICLQLDGIPLAIELAAARTKVLSVEQIYERLNDRFNLLTGGKRTALPRQKTLRALIDWSYDLLFEEEKILWRRLSVFSGGWTLEAAEEVCSDEKIKKEEVLELLNQLTEKSIIIFERENERYSILETLKQYSEEKFNDANEADDFLSKHLHYFMELSETAEKKLYGAEMMIWLKVLHDENGNVEKSLQWSLEGSHIEIGANLACTLGYFWEIRGNLTEGLNWFEKVLSKKLQGQSSAYSKVVSQIGWFLELKGDYERADKFLEESLELYRKNGNEMSIVDSLYRIGHAAFSRGKFQEAVESNEESLIISRKINYKPGIARALNNLGNVSYGQGQYVSASNFYKESLKIRRQLGDKRGIALTLNNLGSVTHDQGDHLKAEDFYRESLQVKREIGNKQGIASCLNNLGLLVYDKGEYVKASILFDESLSIYREIGDIDGIASVLNNQGNVFKGQGKYTEAYDRCSESMKICHKMGDKVGVAQALTNLSNVSYLVGDFNKARELNEEGLKIFREIRDKAGIAQSLGNLGDNASIVGDYVLANSLYEESLEIFEEIGNKLGSGVTFGNLGKLAEEFEEYEKASSLYEKSLAIYREIGDKQGIAEALCNLGNVFLLKDISFASKRFEDSLSISREMSDKFLIAVAILGLGKIAFIKKEYQKSLEFYRQSLSLFCELKVKKEISINILRLMELKANKVLNYAMYCLLGFLKNYFESNRIILPKSEQIVFDALMLKMEKNLIEDEFTKSFEDGKLLNFDEAISLAISMNNELLSNEETNS